MPLDRHQGNSYGNTSISGNAPTHLGDVIHNYHSKTYNDLWALSQIIHTIRPFDYLWDGSPSVYGSHRVAQPRHEREDHQRMNLSSQDDQFSSREHMEYEINRNYWIQKRCKESDIMAMKWSYDELHEFSGDFIGTDQDHHQSDIPHHCKARRPIQQFMYHLSKEAERIRSEDSKGDITSDDIYSVAFEVVQRIWNSQNTWDKNWRILPGESWKNEEQSLEMQSANENVADPVDAQSNGRKEIGEKSTLSNSGYQFSETDTHRQPDVSGAYPGHSQSPAGSCLAELDSTSIAASPSPPTSSQALRNRRSRKKGVPPPSRKENSEKLQNSHKAKSAPSILTRSRRDIHDPPRTSPERIERESGPTTSIPRRSSRNISSPATKAGGIPNRNLKEEGPGKGGTPKISSRSSLKRHGKPKGNLSQDATPED